MERKRNCQSSVITRRLTVTKNAWHFHFVKVYAKVWCGLSGVIFEV
ncbi:DUF3265 domain-containing protein [Vibrio splendidus]|nr:DUF3265 domain-containing protein [Vibrio splendidus]